MKDLLLVFFAGGLGCCGRYLVGGWAQRLTASGFPLGTLAVNALGCFALGVVVGLSLTGAVPPRWKLALGTGFMGGFTTYSAFGVETVRLLEDGLWLQSAANVALQLGLGLPAAALGIWLARTLTA